MEKNGSRLIKEQAAFENIVVSQMTKPKPFKGEAHQGTMDHICNLQTNHATEKEMKIRFRRKYLADFVYDGQHEFNGCCWKKTVQDKKPETCQEALGDKFLKRLARPKIQVWSLSSWSIGLFVDLVY